MKGIIIFTNSRRGRFAAQVETGDFIAFELLDGIELNPGDTIFGNLESLGGETFRFENGKRFSVVVEIAGGSRISATSWASR